MTAPAVGAVTLIWPILRLGLTPPALPYQWTIAPFVFIASCDHAKPIGPQEFATVCKNEESFCPAIKRNRQSVPRPPDSFGTANLRSEGRRVGGEGRTSMGAMVASTSSSCVGASCLAPPPRTLIMIAHGTRIEGSPSGIPHTALRHTQRSPVSVKEIAGRKRRMCAVRKLETVVCAQKCCAQICRARKGWAFTGRAARTVRCGRPRSSSAPSCAAAAPPRSAAASRPPAGTAPPEGQTQQQAEPAVPSQRGHSGCGNGGKGSG